MTAIVEANVRVVVEAYPFATEVAIVALPAGAVARVHHPSGVREYEPQLGDEAFLVVIPGDRDAIGWGWSQGWYETPRGLRRGHRPVNRDAWHAAARAIELGAEVVYVRYEQVDYYGKSLWTAVGIRVEAGGEAA